MQKTKKLFEERIVQTIYFQFTNLNITCIKIAIRLFCLFETGERTDLISGKICYHKISVPTTDVLDATIY